jgi:type I restriction enzyme R subunit
LTATPAAHTTAYFKDTVYRYEYDRAVREGFLVDYDVVKVRSNVRMNGVFLKEGEEVGLINPETGSKKLDSIEDERAFDASTVEREITSPDSCHAGAVTMHYDQCHLSACHPLSFPDGEVVIEHCKIDFAP